MVLCLSRNQNDLFLLPKPIKVPTAAFKAKINKNSTSDDTHYMQVPKYFGGKQDIKPYDLSLWQMAYQ